ncbi:MAG: sigma-54-dependent Fis family transcriptional regulator [Planctomycetes bacterium]|nr:sigma-54-dependent Fis family transcriptional regulator [Planctomycetota bacterium]
MSVRILVVDDEELSRNYLREALTSRGYEVVTASGGSEAIGLARDQAFDVVITDLVMPGIDGLDLVSLVKDIRPQTSVVLVTAYATVERAAEAMERGASDFIHKPLQADQIHFVIQRVLAQRRLREIQTERIEQGLGQHSFQGIVGLSLPMQAVFEQIKSVADVKSTVLVLGESGTGKELVARAIYECGKQKSGQFVAVHCGALSEHLLESELFGHVRGAFTGAVAEKDGLFKAADQGTIFLDEIGDISPEIQLKLLRVLQEREYRPVGSTQTVHVDVRVIAATNRDLKARMLAGKFREDLFYRLNVITIPLPPLRDRREDIPLLANFFFRIFQRQHGKSVASIAPSAMNLLVKYDWPGNVRELQNVLERAVALGKGDEILPLDLPREIRQAESAGLKPAAPRGKLADIIRTTEKEAILEALRTAGGKKEQAAHALGINRSTLWKKMRALGIEEV